MACHNHWWNYNGSCLLLIENHTWLWSQLDVVQPLFIDQKWFLSNFVSRSRTRVGEKSLESRMYNGVRRTGVSQTQDDSLMRFLNCGYLHLDTVFIYNILVSVNYVTQSTTNEYVFLEDWGMLRICCETLTYIVYIWMTGVRVRVGLVSIKSIRTNVFRDYLYSTDSFSKRGGSVWVIVGVWHLYSVNVIVTNFDSPN